MLLDEPLSGLDSDESEHLAGTVLDLVGREQVSFLLVDHDVDTVLGRSDTITVLDFGRVIMSGTSGEVRADARVRAAYLGDPVATGGSVGNAGDTHG